MTMSAATADIPALTKAYVPDDWSDVDARAVDTVRVLAADAVQKVGNGHPGTAMSLAPLAYSLFQKVMRHDPADPTWVGRDRFVLSAGHSSLTLYIQLYLAGFGLELKDLEALRTWGSLTPGHPEFHHTKGVEMTTGPLGQGLSSAVGMAMASRRERGLFDPDTAPGESPFDHFIYVVASDGDIEEGITSEASSIAGRQELGNLIVFYDHNEISIEDDTNIALSEDVAARYRAYGWHVQEVQGGENVTGILEAIEAAKAVTDKPSFIQLRTIIAYPAPTKMNTGASHGSALGAEEIGKLKTLLGFDPDAVVRGRRRGDQAHPAGPGPRHRSEGGVAEGLRRLGGGEPGKQGAVRPAAGPAVARRLDRRVAVLAGGPEGRLHPGRVRRGAHRVGPDTARTVGRLGRPGGVQQHHDEGCRLVRPGGGEDGPLERHPLRADPALRDPGARDGRDPVRHRAARPDPRLRRDVPAVLRLHARRGPVGRGDGRPGDLRLDPRLHRPR